MPSSHWKQIEQIIEICIKLQPKSVLDVGCGFGKFGFLLREYLEVWQNRYIICSWEVVIDAVEVYQKYIGKLQYLLYDDIYQINIRFFEQEEEYDLVLMIDVLEHLYSFTGRSVLRKLLENNHSVLVATPKKWYPQKGVGEHERHKSYWRRKDFKKLGKCQFFWHKRATIVLINAKVPKNDLGRKLRNVVGVMRRKRKNE